MRRATPTLLVDGNNLVHRLWHALPDHNVIKGLVTKLRKWESIFQHRHGAFVFDGGTAQWRKDLHPEYRDRGELDPDISAKLELAKEFVSLSGYPVVQMNGVEADDIIGTLTYSVSRHGDVIIVSNDKDFAQLVNDQLGIWLLRPTPNGEEIFNEGKVLARWGVRPVQMVDFLALMGDSTDGIPGCKGIGEKTASSLLTQYGDLGGIYDSLDSLKPGVRKKLLAGQENVTLAKRLVHLGKGVEGLKVDDVTIQPRSAADIQDFFDSNRIYQPGSG